MIATSGPRRLVWPAVLVAVATAISGTSIALSRRADEHPFRWDPRVARLAAFVEHERGLRFEHPVTVEFLAPAAFRRAIVAAGRDEPGDAGRRRVLAAQLKAFGLLDRDADLDAVLEQLSGEGTLGFYDPRTKQLAVRGSRLDADRRAVVVHELTHALQDQRFGIDGGHLGTAGRDAGFQAVVEGDARAVEDAWELAQREDPVERLRRQAAVAQDARGRLVGVPDVLLELAQVPYLLGPELVRAVTEAQGLAGRNRLFTRPPETEEQVLRPNRYLRHQVPVDVAAPALAAGDVAVRGGDADLGMVSLLVVLGERIDFDRARAAVDGWAGDAVTTFTRRGIECVRARVQFDNTAQAARFDAAFAEWAGGTQATHAVHLASVDLESCAPAHLPPRAPGHLSAVAGLALPLEIAGALEQAGLPRQLSSCVARTVVARVGSQTLYALDQASDGRAGAEEVQRRVTEAFGACGLPVPASIGRA